MDREDLVSSRYPKCMPLVCVVHLQDTANQATRGSCGGSADPNSVDAVMLSLIALLLSALASGVAFSHVLEISGKRRLSTVSAITIQPNLYTGYRTPAAVIEAGAILAALVATVLLWERGAVFGLTLAADIVLLATMIVLVLVTDRQNRRILCGQENQDWVARPFVRVRG